MRIDYECPECSGVTEIAVSPLIPAQTYGDPEKCHPEEGGEIEPEECRHCGCKISPDDAARLAGEAARDAKEYAAECRMDRMRDEGF